MNFAAMLREIVDGCGGGIGAALMGNDGIAIEQVTATHPPESPLSDDIATAGTEFGRILEEIRKAADAVAGGAVLETTIVLSRVVHAVIHVTSNRLAHRTPMFLMGAIALALIWIIIAGRIMAFQPLS